MVFRFFELSNIVRGIVMSRELDKEEDEESDFDILILRYYEIFKNVYFIGIWVFI